MTITHGGNIFAIARERGWDWREVLDLSASINPLGPAPGVKPALEEALERVAHYPGPEPGLLESTLAGTWGVKASQVMAGGGATELLHFFARAGWTGPVALATPVWSEFYRAFPHALKVPASAPERWPQRGLLVLSQPMNPTGEAAPVEQLRRAIAGREGPVLIDESFIEFTRLESALEWAASHPNLLVLRSLSKFHALPGLRVGALAGSEEWIGRLMKRREPWKVSALAEAGALAALNDKAHGERSREVVEREREWLLEEFASIDGAEVTPGEANFLFARTERPAAEVCAALLERKIIVRNCTGLPGVEGEAVRFAVRTRGENERFIEAARASF